MLDVDLQPFTPQRDLPLVAAWLNHAQVARWWGEPAQALAELAQRDARSAALIVAAGRPVGLVCWQRPTRAELQAAGLDDLPGDLVDVDIMIGEPDAIGHGIGPRALRRLFEHLRERGVALVGLASAVANRRALAAWAKAGLQPYRDFDEGGERYRYLTRRLAGAADVQIDEAGPADTEAVLHVERLAFGRDDEAWLVADLLSDPTAQPVLSLLARTAQQPVGHVLFTKATLTGGGRPVRCAILAPLAVVPPWQRQGVGRALIEEGARRLAGTGVQLLFVLGDPGHYTRRGFEPATPRGLHPPCPVVPQQAWMVRALEPGLLHVVTGTVACAASMDRPEYWRE